MKTTHPTTIPIIADALSLLRVEGERVGNDSVGNEVGAMEYSQLQAIQEEP